MLIVAADAVDDVVATGVTVEQLAAIDDEYRYDLIDGELIRMSPAGGEHGEVAALVAWLLNAFVRSRRLGAVLGAETGFVLRSNPDVMLAPDAAFVRTERLPAAGERREFWRLAPDLVVEVVSPTDRWSLVNRKVDQYLTNGVRVVWVIDPAQRTVTVHAPSTSQRTLRTQSGDVLEGGEVLPGLRVPLAELFDLG